MGILGWFPRYITTITLKSREGFLPLTPFMTSLSSKGKFLGVNYFGYAIPPGMECLLWAVREANYHFHKLAPCREFCILSIFHVSVQGQELDAGSLAIVSPALQQRGKNLVISVPWGPARSWAHLILVCMYYRRSYMWDPSSVTFGICWNKFNQIRGRDSGNSQPYHPGGMNFASAWMYVQQGLFESPTKRTLGFLFLLILVGPSSTKIKLHLIWSLPSVFSNLGHIADSLQ